MRNPFSAINEAIEPMRYDGGLNTVWYWAIRIMAIALPIIIVLCVIGVIYCKINGIEISL